MTTINFRTASGARGTARIVSELPTVEAIDYSAGCNQIIRCDRLNATATRDFDEGYYDFYQVTEFWGSQCDDPSEYDSNHESYVIAVWQSFPPAQFRVLPEFIDRWTNEDVSELIVDEAEINRLAREWAVDIDDLMDQVEEI